MNKNNSWIWLLTATLIFIGIILSSQSNAMEEYTATLESQREPDLLVLWRSNQESLNELQLDYYTREREYEDLISITSQGKVSIETFVTEINRTRVFNGDAKTTGPGLEIIFDGQSTLMSTELLDIINELNNSGAEAISINGKRYTSRTHIGEISTETGYTLFADKILLPYPLSIQAIGNYDSLYNGLTIVGGIIDKLNSYNIRPNIIRRENIIIEASSDRDDYPAYQSPDM